MTTFTFGLCAGRHDLPVSDFIFSDGGITFPINHSKKEKRKIFKNFSFL